MVAMVAAIMALIAGVIAPVVATGRPWRGAAHVIRELRTRPRRRPLCPPSCLRVGHWPAAPPLADVLERPLGADALGDSVAVSVVDLSTGTSSSPPTQMPP